MVFLVGVCWCLVCVVAVRRLSFGACCSLCDVCCLLPGVNWLLRLFIVVVCGLVCCWLLVVLNVCCVLSGDGVCRCGLLLCVAVDGCSSVVVVRLL